MNTELVRNWMTPNPITITPQTTLPEARRLMLQFNIRRLPVVNKGRLMGIVTMSDIREAQASDFKMLSVIELNSLLDQLPALEFMSYEPITISPKSMISEAAQLMLRHKIGGLLIVENDELVGILTETDFCRMLTGQTECAV